MPDTSGARRRGTEWTLAHANELRHLIRIRCGTCKIQRHYYPGDLWKLYGNIELERVVSKMFCEKCGKKEYLDIDTVHPTASEIVKEKIRVRTLVEIRWIRRPVWRDDDMPP
ncbi:MULTISPECIES: hypothetical protein [unclassified Mesorhizobium]|uniref:hypothetical protein n=1 Tax=unclassified Mesorhizobium TaxID=325217 RepID=UPI0030154F72